MNCQEITDLMDGYLDGELDPLTSQKVEEHLRDCRKCEQTFETHTALAQAISLGSAYYKAPAELRQCVQSSLRDEIGTKGASQLLVANQQASRRSFGFEPPWNWLALAAAVVLAAIIVSNWLPVSQQRVSDQFLASQLIASHVRSLMADHLVDVPSSDQHTVKPWLDEKLDFAAPVPDLSSQGFPLIGGRLDYLDNHPVAALIYQRRKHYINLFIWPATRATNKGEKTMAHQGYHLLHWIDADFNYWAVSDVSTSDLQTFKQSFEGQVVNH